MSRLFDDANSEYLYRNDATGAVYPFAVCGWFRMDNAQLSWLVGFADKDENDDYFRVITMDAAGGQKIKLICNEHGSGGGATAETTSGYTVDVWCHFAALFVSATDRRILIDNGSKGTNTTDKTPAALDKFCIGGAAVAPFGGSMSGEIAEVAMWDLSAYPGATAALKANYFEANVLPGLAGNEPPSTYTTGLEAYWPFETSSIDDEADGFDLTNSGSNFSYDHPSVYRYLGGSVDAQSALAADAISIEELAGAITVQSTVEGAIDKVLVFSLGGLIAVQSVVTGDIFEISKLAGTIAAQSALTAKLRDLSSLSGTCDAHTTVVAALSEVSSLGAVVAAQSTATGKVIIIQSLAGIIAAQSSVSALLQEGYKYMPPAMHAALIDPYLGGAWLWLVEIRIPGYDLITFARNTEDKIYAGITYTAWNFHPRLVALTSDGSVPRTVIQVAQDANHTLEDKLNATKGGYGGTVKIIRAHEDFLDNFIAELEDNVDILMSQSTTDFINIICGIPNPLLRKIPLRRYSSKICPYFLAGLFGGPECGQLTGVCPTGSYDDCLALGNEARWGGEPGLDPCIAKI